MTLALSRLLPPFRLPATLPMICAALVFGTALQAQNAPHDGQLLEDPPAPQIVMNPPQGPVVLTLHGQIGVQNSENGAELDLDMLKSLGVSVVDTSTIWTRQSNRFEGVKLAAVLEAVAAQGSKLRLRALNDYAYEVEIAEILLGDPILAFVMDGVTLSPRDKGPLWLIYPFDQSPEFQTEQHFVRAIWQLKDIEILP